MPLIHVKENYTRHKDRLDRYAQLTHAYGSGETEVRLHCYDITASAARSTKPGMQGGEGQRRAPRKGLNPLAGKQRYPS